MLIRINPVEISSIYYFEKLITQKRGKLIRDYMVRWVTKLITTYLASRNRGEKERRKVRNKSNRRKRNEDVKINGGAL